MKEDYPKLFEPITIGNVELMNRVVFPPISTNFALENGRLTERFVKHYERRARGGVGLIIVEKEMIKCDVIVGAFGMKPYVPFVIGGY